MARCSGAHTPRGPHWDLMASCQPHSHPTQPQSLLAPGTHTESQGWDKEPVAGPSHMLFPVVLCFICPACHHSEQHQHLSVRVKADSHLALCPVGHASSVDQLPINPACPAMAGQPRSQSRPSRCSQCSVKCGGNLGNVLSSSFPWSGAEALQSWLGMSPWEHWRACLLLISFPCFLLRALRRGIIIVRTDC